MTAGPSACSPRASREKKKAGREAREQGRDVENDTWIEASAAASSLASPARFLAMAPSTLATPSVQARMPSAAALICSSEICSSRRIGDERAVTARRIEGLRRRRELSCSALQPESSNVRRR